MDSIRIMGTVNPSPLTFIGRCAGISTERMDRGDPVKRAMKCLSDGHLSVFEHLSVTWEVRGVSRALTHQLVRHRHCSFTQESQRYTKVDVLSDDWYVMPENLEPDQQEWFRRAMTTAAQTYQGLIDMGVKKEDARAVLPNATKTAIVVTMNLAEFAHFYRLRSDPAAQAEIRHLANAMWGSLRSLGGQWEILMDSLKE